jgi:hypothetical protein
VTDDIVNDPIDFHTANTVLDQHSDVRNPLIVGFFVIGQCTVAWLLLRLEDDHPRQGKSLKPTILPEHAPFWQTILGFIRYPFIMRFTCIGRTQEPDASSRIYQQHILDGMVFLFATVVDFLFIAVFRSCYRSFGSILAKKGGASGSRCAVSACNWAANSTAVRAGSTPWLAKAVFRMSSSSRTHLLTFD